jgi:molecular chaperone GrpE (heat shock protein)
MNDNVITIKEASTKYSKAEITIRRLIRSIVQNEQSDDRQFIYPRPDEVQKLKKQQKPFTYTVNELLLDKVFGEVAKVNEAKKKTEEKKAEFDQNEYFALLKEQLSVKDEQIRALNQSLDEMTMRTRETNILMKGMQEKIFQLPTAQEAVVDVETSKKAGWWFW